LSICGSFAVLSLATFYIELKVPSALPLNITFQVIKGAADQSFQAVHQGKNQYIVSFRTEEIGTHFLAVWSEQQQLANSPFRLEVNLPTCTEFPGKVPDLSGNCVCPSRTETDIGGKCVSYILIISSVIVPISVLLASSAVGYFLFHTLRKWQARAAFLNALRNVMAGDTASIFCFPPDHIAKKGNASPSLRMQYDALTVLGKGGRGCVIKAAKKCSHKSAQIVPMSVAIKIIVPKRDKFDKAEKHQLEVEARLLNLTTSKVCKSAVQAAEVANLQQRDDVCWFIMEVLDGETLAAELYPQGALTALAVGVGACIQAARDVLAALKVLHSDGFVHCDVAPANIIHLAKGQRGGYEYKLIDFGKARAAARHFEDDALQAAHSRKNYGGDAASGSTNLNDVPADGEVPYRAPELFLGCCAGYEADIWSLGATMFELVSGIIPFVAEGRAAAVKSGTEGQAPNLVDCLPDDQRQGFDEGLAKVIAKALERNPKKRYCCDSSGEA
jgi:serine/threonine protein kinase